MKSHVYTAHGGLRMCVRARVCTRRGGGHTHIRATVETNIKHKIYINVRRFLRSLPRRDSERAGAPGREKYCMNHLSVWLRLSVAARLRIVSSYIYKCARRARVYVRVCVRISLVRIRGVPGIVPDFPDEFEVGENLIGQRRRVGPPPPSPILSISTGKLNISSIIPNR